MNRVYLQYVKSSAAGTYTMRTTSMEATYENIEKLKRAADMKAKEDGVISAWVAQEQVVMEVIYNAER